MSGRRGAWLPGLALALSFAALSSRKLGDFDLPWHLALGRQIASSRSLPRVDDLAYTHRPIEYMEFVSDLLLYAAHRVAGPLGLQILTAAVVSATAVVCWSIVRRSGPVAWIVVALGIAAMDVWLLARPATFGFCLLAVFLALIERHRAGPESPAGRRALIALVPLTVLWANMHPSVVLGLIVLWGYAAHRVLGRALQRSVARGLFPATEASDGARTALVALASTLASGVNLGGFGLLAGPLRAREHFSTVTEWAKPSLEFLFRSEPAVGGLLIVVVGATLFGKEAGKRLPSAFDAGLVVLAISLSATAVRLIAFAAILVIPMAARRLAAFVGDTLVMRLVATLSLCALGLTLFVRSTVGLGVGFEPTHFPEGAVRYIEAKAPRGNLYNFMPFGGYLEWRLHPRYRVLVDGRSAFVHDPALMARVHDANFDTKVFSGLVEQYDLQWAVTRSREGESFGQPLASGNGFRMVFFDDVGAVYVREDGENAALAKEGYRAFTHLTPLPVALDEVMRGVRTRDWDHDGALAAEQAPGSPRAQVLDACGALAAVDRPRFSAALSRLDALAPGHPALGLLEDLWGVMARGRAEPPEK